MTTNEKEVFNLIYEQRTKNSLHSLKVNDEIQRVARIRAQDIMDSNYFSHNSPTYGSPFEIFIGK